MLLAMVETELAQSLELRLVPGFPPFLLTVTKLFTVELPLIRCIVSTISQISVIRKHIIAPNA